ncbi:MAG TPA: SdpI family protein [Sedimentisphaerales bacterium]|nr:SdpI family protein [Sedimentisphaerales bacterium]
MGVDAFTLLITGSVFIIISIPMLFNKIGPNYFYGFRNKKTLSNKEIWYKANRFMAKCLIIAGAVILTTGILLTFIKTAACICTGVITILTIIIPTSIAVIMSMMYLKKL